MSTGDETESVLLQELTHDITAEGERYTTIILTPTSDVLQVTTTNHLTVATVYITAGAKATTLKDPHKIGKTRRKVLCESTIPRESNRRDY